jgi:hypothetical protein
MQTHDRSDSWKQFILDRTLFISVALISLFVYFVHLTSFSISIDEELASFSKNSGLVWIAQGRWGMALVGALLPDSSAIPFVSTLAFILASTAASLIFASLVAKNKTEAFVFAGIFVSSPIWLHLVEFNTIATGAGLGLLVTALGVALVSSGRAIATMMAAVCVSFAIGLYQAFIILYAIACLIVLFPGCHFWKSEEQRVLAAPFKLFVSVIFSLCVGFLFYLAVQRISLLISHQSPAYVESYIQISELTSNFASSVVRILNIIKGLILGTDPTYLGWGIPLLLLPIIGFFVGLYNVTKDAVSNPIGSMVSLGCMVVMIVAASALIIMAAGRMPTRALIGFPFVFAMLALNCFRTNILMLRGRRWLAWILFFYAIVISGWIGASLFYADHVARQRDQVLATRLASMVEDVGRPVFGNDIPFVLVGQKAFPDEGVARHVQIFGTSFFEQDGGNPYRVAAYFRLLGIGNLRPLSLDVLEGNMAVIEAMPIWPAPGSIAVVNHVLVIKLGKTSYQQQLMLKHDVRG